ncbi:MAG TPA: hypothetical protein VH834_16065 [Solirubrobacteraceae bacterium]
MSAFAVAWCAALVIGVFVVPAYSDGSTLAQENSAWVAVPAAVPALLAGLAVFGLHLRRTRGGAGGTVCTCVAIVLMLAFGVVTMWSIGLFAVIPALLLAVAAALTPPTRT